MQRQGSHLIKRVVSILRNFLSHIGQHLEDGWIFLIMLEKWGTTGHPADKADGSVVLI